MPVRPLAVRPILASVRPGVNFAVGPGPSNVPGHAAAEGHRPGRAVAVDLDVQPAGQGVDHRGTDAVQPAGRVVGAGAELAARVQLGEHHLHAGQAGTRFPVDRDAAALVVDRNAAIGPQCDQDLTAESAEGLVDRVVDDLPQAVHQTAGVGRPDVHGRPLPDGLQTLQHQQMSRLVVATFGSWTGGRHGCDTTARPAANRDRNRAIRSVFGLRISSTSRTVRRCS